MGFWIMSTCFLGGILCLIFGIKTFSKEGFRTPALLAGGVILLSIATYLAM